jgi:hypothetical protein
MSTAVTFGSEPHRGMSGYVIKLGRRHLHRPGAQPHSLRELSTLCGDELERPMLFRPRLLRLLPRYRRLLRDGVEVDAVVVKSAPWGWVVNRRIPNVRLTLRIRFDDDSTTMIDRVERDAVLGSRRVVGSILPMRYEAAERSYVEIDVPRLRVLERRSEARLERSAVRAAERKLAKERRKRP